MWRPSPSPEETWSDASGANEDGEWPVKGVVGEEIRLDGTSRYRTIHHGLYSLSQRAFTGTRYVCTHPPPRADPDYLCASLSHVD